MDPDLHSSAKRKEFYLVGHVIMLDMGMELQGFFKVCKEYPCRKSVNTLFLYVLLTTCILAICLEFSLVGDFCVLVVSGVTGCKCGQPNACFFVVCTFFSAGWPVHGDAVRLLLP